MRVFYRIDGVPVHNVLLMPTREEAVNYPSGNIHLGHCESCGFIRNVAFHPDLHEYSARYEETQGFSPTFNAFHQNLAGRLIDQFQLQGKDILEIGCGKGEFLALLCRLGDNRGVGFDPSYVEERLDIPSGLSLTFIRDFYSERYAKYQADFVCCKMTLEHIHRPLEFIESLKPALKGQKNPIVFFMVPDAGLLLRQAAFWDVYYEHCSYFTDRSLARLFRGAGFEIVDLEREYEGQYLSISLRLTSPSKSQGQLDEGGNGQQIERYTDTFSNRCNLTISAWQDEIERTCREKGQVVLWGGRSKAVSFLSHLGLAEEIQYVVDINPYRQGTFIAGSGQEIIAPDQLQEIRPHLVVVMNPVYCAEIEQSLGKMGLNPEVRSVESIQ